MRYPLFRLGIFILASIWPLWWLYEAAMQALGPDPGKILVDRLGLGALTFLLITLSMTPLQRLTVGRAGSSRGASWACGALPI